MVGAFWQSPCDTPITNNQGGINSPTQFIDTAPEEDLQVCG